MSGTTIVCLTFVAVFLGIFSANLVLVDLFQRDRKGLKNRMEQEMRRRQQQKARESSLMNQDLSQMAEEAFRENSADAQSWRERLQAFVEQSGLHLTPSRLLTMAATSSLLAGAFVGLLAESILLGIIVLALTAATPLGYVHLKRSKRLAKLRSQLPDCFDLMARLLRAGQTMSQAMQSASQEFEAPLSTEFAYCYEQQNLGLAPDFALRDLARRTGLLEIKIFVLALLVHRQTGGNLTELLDNLATIVRQRFLIRGKIASLTAEGRVQALILLSLPPVIFAVLLCVNREYALKLFEHPELPVVSVISMTLGAVWIRKIVNFDF